MHARPEARQRLVLALLALLPVMGTWIGHTLEYLRLWGINGLDAALFGPVHGYMIPAGLLLATVAAAGAGAVLATGRRLDRLASDAARRLQRVLAGHTVDASGPVAERRVNWVRRLAILAAIYLLVQVCLYVAQENLEALAAHVTAPGLGAVTGIHIWAPVIQAAIAINMAAVAVLILQGEVLRIQAIHSVLRLVRMLVDRLVRAPRPRPGALAIGIPVVVVHPLPPRGPPLGFALT